MATALTPLISQMLRFGAVGVVNTSVGLTAIYAFMYVFRADPISANVLGYIVGFSVSFWLNRLWTFESNGKIADVLPRYAAVVAAAFLVNLTIVGVSTGYFAFNPYLSQIAGVIAYTTLSFTWCRVYVFPQTPPQTERVKC
jgi:putative flippase GtrA